MQSETEAILRATAEHPRDHLIYSLALGTGTAPGDALQCSQSRARISKRRVQFAWRTWQQKAGFDRLRSDHCSVPGLPRPVPGAAVRAARFAADDHDLHPSERRRDVRAGAGAELLNDFRPCDDADDGAELPPSPGSPRLPGTRRLPRGRLWTRAGVRLGRSRAVSSDDRLAVTRVPPRDQVVVGRCGWRDARIGGWACCVQ